MKIKTFLKFSMFAAAFSALLCLTTVSLRAGTITVVNLPPTGTDLATGITTNKTYVGAFNFGSQNATIYSVNGVPFAHFRTSVNNVFLVTNWIDTVHGGQVIVSTAITNKGIDVASSAGQGNLAAQADGNMRSILTDLMYSGNGAPIGGWLEQEYDNLTVGHQYSLRIYYRFWSGNRLQNVWFNGEGTWVPYSGNPLDEDAGTNGISHGARYLEYDFTADATNVFCLASNLVANGATMIEAATLEDDSIPYAPFITHQASVAGIGSGMYQFSVQAIGTPPLSYQWYTNSTASYSGAAMVTDSADYSGSTTSNLTTTATTTTNELLNYYFVVVANAQGYATSSIVQINPSPNIVTQPTPTNVANSYVQFSVTAGGFPPLTYQWYANGSNTVTGAIALTDGNGVSGSTTSSLTTTTNLQDYYFVVVSDTYGAATSSMVVYNPNPKIVTQPTVAKAGPTAQISVGANGWPTLDYQWYFNNSSSYSGASVMTDGNGVSGSTTPTVTITNLLDYYFVVVTNYYGSATSQVVAAAIPLTVTSAGEPIWNTTSQTNIIVAFSDTVDPATATTLANYSLSPGATISSAALVAPNEVALTTAPLSGSYALTVQGVKDLDFNLLMTPSPTNVAVGLYPANIALWVRANTGVTTDSGANTVYGWNDLSGNGNNLASYQGGTPYEPQLVTNAWGDPVIRFEATNETVMFAQPSASLGITGDMSIIAVANFATFAGGTNGEIVSKTGGAGLNIPAPYDYYVQSTTSGTRLYRGNGTNYGQVTASSVPSVDIPHILAVSETGNTVSHYLDGQAAGTGILNNGFQETNCLDAQNQLQIGTREDQANRLTGDLAELIIAGSTISSYDVSQLTPYLAQEHNISLVNSSPTNIVFSVAGGNLTLSWPADQLGWTLQAQTNSLSVGISTNWVSIPASTTVDQMTIPMNVTNGSVFYRLIYNP